MLYNRFTEHVVNDRKKMYKRGSQWVVASAFMLLFGGVALSFRAQPVDAATSTVSSGTVTKRSNDAMAVSVTQSSAATSVQAQAQQTSGEQEKANTVMPNAAATTQKESAGATINQPTQVASSGSSGVYQAAQQTANINGTSVATTSNATLHQSQAQGAKLDSSSQQNQALSAANTETATKPNLQSSSANNAVANQKKQQRTSAVNASAAVASNVQSAAQNTATVTVGDGGTFNYVVKTGAWNNIVTPNDSKTKTWNGNVLFQNVPALTDQEVAEQDQIPKFLGVPDTTTPAGKKYLNKAGLFTNHEDAKAPAWSLGDTVKNDVLSPAQKYEVNQYAMMLTNNYRKALGLAPLVSTSDFLALTQERGDTVVKDKTLIHDYTVLNRIFGKYGAYGECLATHQPEWFELMGDRTNNLTMLDVLESVAQGVTNLFNWDGPEQGHRQILLSESVASATGAWSDQKNAAGDWELNFNSIEKKLPGTDIAAVSGQDQPSTGSGSASS
ncbi:SEC10/PgrA surface exclusion domain-containing protein, partial [Lacticaseibacillus rhamnosus]